VTDHRDESDGWIPSVLLHVNITQDFLDRSKLLREPVRESSAGGE
jgi:hypothetical protein